jgi:peptidoglycan/xylan/chitin deacetylase (PgdA/CDA1 family)
VNIFLTFDYELFFGPQTGTVEKCMLEPADELMRIACKNAKLVFFVDVGFLIRAEYFSQYYPELTKNVNSVRFQIKRMIDQGHDVQLHIHPHWEKSVYADGKWQINAEGAYKLDDFSDDEIVDIVTRYKSYLDDLVGYKTIAFRAGGWCVQPFSRLKNVFQKLGIRFDSSVIPGMKYETAHYFFDFTAVTIQEPFSFTDDVCKEETNGAFIEYPISSIVYPPTFYWKLYALGRLFPEQHKMVGDGSFIPQPGRKRSGLTEKTRHHVSCDGYYSSVLKRALTSFEKEGRKNMVVIGHPKGMTNFSFKKLEEFIQMAEKEHQFMTFKDLE